MRRFLILVLLFTVVDEAAAEEKLWVKADSLNRRTCPATSCGSVGKLFYREAVTVFERSGGWARVTHYYDAACSGGLSSYVDSGNNACDPSNGIVDGQFAEWVSLEFLVANRPADPAADATGTAKLVGQSDDFRLHQAAFVRATEELIAAGTCSEIDFQEMGGWIKSTNHASEPVYFTYCGGTTLANRLYLNPATGEVFR